MPKKPGKIFVVATPIGNLEDITYRAVRLLRQVDLVVAEDTRVTRKLLAHLQIEKPLERLDEHASSGRVDSIVKRIEIGANAALLTDAGTPNISDPGWKLIRAALYRGIEAVPIPGPSALAALVSISHFPLSEFVFVGFPPAKKGRRKFFDSIAETLRPVIIYESTHRIVKTLTELSTRSPEREAVAAKELTKVHERVWRGRLSEIHRAAESLSDQERKGEWAIALARPNV